MSKTLEDLICIRDKMKAAIADGDAHNFYDIMDFLKQDCASLTNIINSIEPEIPEGFTRYDGGAQPVPDGVVVECIVNSGTSGLGIACEINWENIIAYRVVSVPTLTIDDVKKGDEFFTINDLGELVCWYFSHAHVNAKYARVEANMAYATKALAECAYKHRCFNSEGYKRTFCDD